MFIRISESFLLQHNLLPKTQTKNNESPPLQINAKYYVFPKNLQMWTENKKVFKKKKSYLRELFVTSIKKDNTNNTVLLVKL